MKQRLNQGDTTICENLDAMEVIINIATNLRTCNVYGDTYPNITFLDGEITGVKKLTLRHNIMSNAKFVASLLDLEECDAQKIINQDVLKLKNK